MRKPNLRAYTYYICALLALAAISYLVIRAIAIGAIP